MAYTTVNKSGDYFNTKLYTGTGSAQNITGVGFQPDWVWTKQRSGTEHHNSNDAVRGATKVLFPNLTNAEQTVSNLITGFVSDGFSVGDNSGSNNNNSTYVSWNWKAGTTGSGTTTGAGTGKAYSYSVNTTAGFSIVKFIGNGSAGHTIPHHLGAKADFVIIKGLASGRKWSVGTSALGWTKELFLDGENAQNTSASPWYDTAPSSTVVTLGTGSNGNTNDETYIMYAFSTKTGYSKFGTYTGNGNANGPFIYTGFKPAFVITKIYSHTDGWSITDRVRDLAVAPNGARLIANDTQAEQTNETWAEIEKYSNGFKIKGTDNVTNASSRNYIYVAFGQSIVGTNNIAATAG